MSQFSFLQSEWPTVLDAAARAESAVYADPRTACFYARRALELAVGWAYKHDSALKLPYQDNLSALIHEPSFKQTVGEAVLGKARIIVTLGNRAVHSHRPVPGADALAAVRELFHFAYWLARTYGRAGRPAPGLAFDSAALPRPGAAAQQTAEQLRALQDRLRERDEKLTALLADKGTNEAKFRSKAQAFLRRHLDHVAIAKLYRNRPLTAADIAELERMLIESGIGAPEDIGRASKEAHGLGLFVRSLVGLDRGAAKDAMAGFTAGKALSANQLEFINLVVDHLTAHGVMDPAQLYESPFTDIAARGPDELFDAAQVDELVSRLEAVKSTALAA